MKLTKSGEIEACCAYIGEIQITGGRFERSATNIYCNFTIPTKNGEYQVMPIFFNFCPNCGSKTEIEGD